MKAENYVGFETLKMYLRCFSIPVVTRKQKKEMVELFFFTGCEEEIQ